MLTIKKMTPQLHDYLLKKVNKYCLLHEVVGKLESEAPELFDEFSEQIVQYGPETAVGDLILMARDEKPEKKSLWQIFKDFIW